MSQPAHVSSLDALESFRANLIVYLSQARPALEEVSAGVVRTRMWLEDEQRVHWEGQMRHCLKELEQAQEALFSARLGNLRPVSAAEQFAVQRAKRAVDEADFKLKTVKKWNREFDGRMQPLIKQMEKLHQVLSNDMVQAVGYLTQVISTLATYAELNSSGQGAPPTAAAPQVGLSTVGETTAKEPSPPRGAAA